MQLADDSAEKVPAAQGAALHDPSSQKYPAVQHVHAVLAMPLGYVPAGHGNGLARAGFGQ